MNVRVSSAPPSPPPAPHAYPRLRRFAIDAAITAGFNVAIALVITYVLRLNSEFFDNLVISMCIGLLMVSFIDGGRLLLWGMGKPPRLPFALLFTASVPAALMLGNLLGGLLLGIPEREIATARATNPAGFYVMFLFICVAITWFFWNRSQVEMLKADAEAEKAHAAAIEKQALQAQLQMLQAQIEPHMLFNTLANLQGLIALDPQRAQRMIDQLIQYLRATLSASRAESTTLSQEFVLLDAYLGLMKIRMDTRLSYRLDLPDALHALPVAPMLLQPLVENAIKHGLEPKIDGGQITVTAARAGETLLLTVADTGLGLQALPETAGDGVGTANLRARLHALYGERASLSLEANQPHGLRAVIAIPLEP